MPKISIIIPVYKVEEYLPACLDSVLAQTFPDWEVICVNDGSPDNCGTILAEYAQKDSRIKVITQDNQGVSVARNKAMEVAQGEYISFLDSDDELAPTFLQKMYQAIMDTNSDMVWCDFQQGEVKQPWQEQNADIKVYTNAFDKFIEEKPNMGAVIWNKLYKKELLEKFQFKTEISQGGEDILYLYQAVYYAKNITHIHNELYFYRTRPDSVMTSRLSERFVLGNIKLAKLLFEFFKDKELFPKTRKVLNRKIAKRMFKFAVLEPKRKDKANLDKWYALTRPQLEKLKRIGVYQPKYLSLKNQFKSWLFLQNWECFFYRKLKVQKLQIKVLGISVSLKIKPWVRNLLQKNKEKRTRIILRKNNKIRVGFLVTECSKWGYQSVYDLFKESKDFEPIILITKTFIEHKERENCGHSFQDCCDFFKKKGMAFELAYDLDKKCPIPLNQLDIGIVFYQQPWDVAKEHHPYDVSKYALTCYISYGFSLLNSDFMYSEGFDRWLDINFLMSSANLEEIKEKIDDVKNCVVVGSPKLDYYHYLTESKRNKPVIIYAPHHSFDLDWLNLATFKKNGKEILELAQKYQDQIDWVFKPHPRFKFSLLKNGIMAEEEVEKYYACWEKIGRIYEKGDYIELFKNSDGLITDCCSFLAEYLPSKHPVFHLINEGCSWNKLANAFIGSYYTALTFEQFEKDFNQVILNKDDYKKEERLSKIPVVLDETTTAASKIYQEVKAFLKELDLT